MHGALCVSYSGQCFSSEAWGGRSANRGQCAQACRLPYEMIVDGTVAAARRRALPALAGRSVRAAPGSGDRRHRHLGAQDRRPLQGRRLRRADHRAPTARRWTRPGRARRGASTPAEELQLEQVYSRGLGPYFVTGTNHQAVVRGPRAAPSRRADGPRGASHRERRRDRAGGGARASRRSSRATAWSSTPPTGAAPKSRRKAGASIRRCRRDGAGGALRQRRGRLRAHPPRRPASGAPTIPTWTRPARPFTEAAAPAPQAAGDACASSRAKASRCAAEWTWWSAGQRVTVESAAPLGAARNRAAGRGVPARKQFGRLGNTPYELAALELEVDGHRRSRRLRC